MFQKVLLLVDDRPESIKAVDETLRLAKMCDARIFAAWVLPPAGKRPEASSAASVPPRARRRRKPSVENEIEERAWSRLYEIEDRAFEENVRISLLLENGSRDDVMLGLIESYQLDALVIGTRSVAGWEDLIGRAPVTVLLIR